MSSGPEMPDRAGPPPVPVYVRIALHLFLDEEDRRAVLDELAESREIRVQRDGRSRADRWYARQLRRLLLPLARERMRRAFRGSLSSRDAPSPSRASGRGVLRGMAADARYALRGWARSPVLALVILVTVGLGLGASAAMFAVVRTVLLEPLPYPGSERLVRIYHAIQHNRWSLSVVDYQAIEAQQTQFESVGAYTSGEQTLTTPDGAERVRVRPVTAGLFGVLGVHAAVGRTFEPAEGNRGAARVAVVSRGFWRRALGDDPSAIGRTIRLNGSDYTVIGVLPRQAGPLLERYDVFPALQFEPPTRKGPFYLTVVGRMRADTGPVAAEAELRAINRRIFPIWRATFQDSTSTWGLMPLDEFVVGRYRTMLLVLMGAVVLVLLIASTNAAGLLTARAMQRHQELAARAALGASRGRLVRLLVTESALIGLCGAFLGLSFAAAALRVVRAAGPDVLPRAGEIALDGPTLAATAVMTLASIIVFGLIPALQVNALRDGLANTLRSGGRTLTGAAAAHRTRRILVGAQFAIAVPLLAGAALLLNSFARLQRVDPGFDTSNIITAAIARAPAGDDGGTFWPRLVEGVRALPGVTSAGLASARPPCCASDINNFDPIDRPTPPGESEPLAAWVIASPGYFDALGIRLVAGRLFDERDRPGQPSLAVVVDRTWAENLYPGEDPIGRRFYEGGCRDPECAVPEVVGVVENVRYLGLDDSQNGSAVGTVYVPLSQWGAPTEYLFVHTAGDPLPLLSAIRDVVHRLDPTVPVTSVSTADELVQDALATPRNITAFVLAFAAIALVLATIGIYGVMSFFVHEHRRDIGIRLALGGRPGSVQRLVIRRGMQPVLLGTLCGFALAIGITRFMQRLLFGVAPRDPATLTVVGLAMILTAAVACWLPARSAARLQPIETLRTD